MPLITPSRLCRLRLESAAKLHLWCSANPTVQRVACLAQRSRRLATSAAPTGPENRELKKSQPTAAASSALRHRALRTDEYEKVKEILSRHVSRKDLGAEWTNYKFTSLSIKFRVLSEVQKEFKGVHLGNADITNIVDVRSLISAVRNAPRTPRNEFSDADPVEALFWKLAAQQRLPANLYFKGAKGAPARQGPPATTAPAAEADVEHKGVPNE